MQQWKPWAPGLLALVGLGCLDLLGARPLAERERLVLTLAQAGGASIGQPAPVLVVRRQGGTGHTDLVVDEDRLADLGHGVLIGFSRICQFDDRTSLWSPLAWHYLGWQTLSPRDRADDRPPRVVTPLTRTPGLFWIQWSENTSSVVERLDGTSPPKRHTYRTLLAAGPLICEDIALGPAPPGQVAACVGGVDSARARFVPDPVPACTR